MGVRADQPAALHRNAAPRLQRHQSRQPEYAGDQRRARPDRLLRRVQPGAAATTTSSLQGWRRRAQPITWTASAFTTTKASCRPTRPAATRAAAAATTRATSGAWSTPTTARFGGARKLCFTEFGYLTPEGYPPLPGAFGWAQNVTVAAAGRRGSIKPSRWRRSSGKVRLLIIWNIDFTSYGADPQAGYAIIRPGGGCPACDALAN